jgi:Zn-dependent protease/predicted transcriptional regulator
MLNTNIRLFKLWGIPVEVNLSWLFVLALMTWTFSTRYYPSIYPGAFDMRELWILGFLTAILLFLSILMHEFSHSIVATRNGISIKKITLFMFGGVAHMSKDVDKPGSELKTAAAGPAMTVLLIAAFYGISLLSSWSDVAFALFRSLMRINIIVLVFNMVPGFPLDGGRILRAAIWYKTGNISRATRIASRIGRGFAVFLMIIGMINFFAGNFIGGLWMVFIGFFLYQAAQASYTTVAVREAIAHLSVADVMKTSVVTVDISTTLRSLVDDHFLKHHYDSYPVLDGQRSVGIVSLKHVKGIRRELWTEITVEEVMDRDVMRFALRPSDPATKVVELVMKRGYGRLPVIDSDGAIIGIVTRSDLMDALKLMAYLGEDAG